MNRLEDIGTRLQPRHSSLASFRGCDEEYSLPQRIFSVPIRRAKRFYTMWTYRITLHGGRKLKVCGIVRDNWPEDPGLRCCSLPHSASTTARRDHWMSGPARYKASGSKGQRTLWNWRGSFPGQGGRWVSETGRECGARRNSPSQSPKRKCWFVSESNWGI